ncbi:MAG: 2-phosphosulfolactate phosphatase [Saprospiraceae bacterium]|nr:2-phosphosulfolactate phosphatase [Saprospiraceae bacterium]
MQIKIYRCLEGAQKARGLTVLFDVFRASNTIIACLAGGAEFVLPIGDLDEAHRLKKQHPGYMLLGERNGIPPKGFDGDNSPAKAACMDLEHKKIILTTSAGSQGIVHANQADLLVIGSFANAKAITEYIRAQQPEIVSLLAIGLNAIDPAHEDEACAQYIQQLLDTQDSEFAKIQEDLLACNGADRLRRLHQHEDLLFCTTMDSHPIVPVFDALSGRITKLV